MIESFYELGMTDDQLKTVAMISLNWSVVEREITDILRSFYAFKNDQDAIDLVTVLDLDKKIGLCQKKIDSKPANYTDANWPKAATLIEHLRKNAAKFREGRNYVIHGTVIRFFGSVRDPAILSHKKSRTIEMTALPLILEQSAYLTHVMGHLAGALYGWEPPQPLPDIPA